MRSLLYRVTACEGEGEVEVGALASQPAPDSFLRPLPCPRKARHRLASAFPGASCKLPANNVRDLPFHMPGRASCYFSP
jgi:hypothetical protein